MTLTFFSRSFTPFGMQHGFLSVMSSFYDPPNLPLDTKIIIVSLVGQEIYAILKTVTLIYFSRSFTFSDLHVDVHLDVVADMFLNSLIYDIL